MSTNQRSALVLLLGDPSCDPRPNRMINFLLESGYQVDALSYDAKKTINLNQHYVVKKPRSIVAKIFLRLIRYINSLGALIPERFKDTLNDFSIGVGRFKKDLCHSQYSLLVVEDLFLLPLANSIKNGAYLIFDAREYYTRQNEDSFIWRLFEQKERVRLCKRYLHTCDHVLTVSNGLASEYESDFKIKPTVYMSVPHYAKIEYHPTSEKSIRMVHHGVANKNRQLEKMIDLVSKLDARFTLDLYLVGNPSYRKKLMLYASSTTRVRFIDPVEFRDIVPMLSAYDIGLYYLEPNGFNVTRNLPNKFFEFIQARLAIAIGPSPDMSEIALKYNCAVIASTFSIDAMAEKLNGLSAEDVNQLKRKSNEAAKVLNFEQESKKLMVILDYLEYRKLRLQ